MSNVITMKCSLCLKLVMIDNSDFAVFYQHVKHFHSHLAPFHIVCVHPAGCQKHFHVFNSFRRHWSRYHGSCRVGENSELFIILVSIYIYRITHMCIEGFHYNNNCGDLFSNRFTRSQLDDR